MDLTLSLVKYSFTSVQVKGHSK